MPDTATIGDRAFPSATTVLRLPPKRMRDLQRWCEAVDGALAYKRCRPLLYGWLERAQTGSALTAWMARRASATARSSRATSGQAHERKFKFSRRGQDRLLQRRDR